MVVNSKRAKFDSKFVIVSSILLVIILACFVLADMSSTINGSSATILYTTATNQLFNFTVLNAGQFVINQTNFTFSGLTVVLSTNGTDALGNYVNTSTYSSWTNNTGALIPNGTSRQFWANLTGAEGIHNVTLRTRDVNGIENSTTLEIVIDRSVPSSVVLNSPIGYTNLSSSTVSLNVTATDAISNITSANLSCSYLLNGGSLSNQVYTGYSAINGTRTTINRFSLADGLYDWNVTCSDATGNSNSSDTQYFRVDTTAPATVIVSPASSYNTSSTGILLLNATVNDSGVGLISSFIFNITNSTGSQNLSFNAASNGVAYSNSTGFNLSLLPVDGIYYVTVKTNDSVNNINNTASATVIIDRTNPLISLNGEYTRRTYINFSIHLTDPTSGIGSSCIVNRSDGTIVNVTGTGLVQYAYESGLTCNTDYDYYISCNDTAGNINNTMNYSQRTSDCEDVATSSGSGGAQAVSSDELTSGLNSQPYIGTVLGFNTAGEHHSFMITTIADNKVTFKLSSTPQYATLSAGETGKYDLNSDGTYDLSVTVNSIISSNRADITLKAISEPVAAANNSSASEEKTTGQKVSETVKSVTNNSKTWWIVGIIIVIAIVLYLIFRKK